MVQNLFLTTLIALTIIGCATSSYTIKIDSIADSDAFFDTYILQSGMKSNGDNDLRFKEYARVVSNSLTRKGFKPTNDIKSADVIVLLSYGISAPNTRSYTRSVPVYGQNNTTTTVTNNWGQQIGSFQTQQTNPYAPSGYQSVTDEVTTYDRFILLTAYDAKDVVAPREQGQNFNPKMIWETKITSTGSSGDLRKIFPVMMLGALPYIAENTEEQIVVDLNIDEETDPRIASLKSNRTQPNSKRTPSSKAP